MSPKSNANRRNRATRRAARLADVPPHPLITYAPGSAALSVDLDFKTSRSLVEETKAFDTLVEILPKYGDETNIIHLRMLFRPTLKDVEGISRHEVLARVVEVINEFPHIQEIAFSIVLDHFNWKQINSASSIYCLKFLDWTFDLNVRSRKVKPVLINSSIDRRLRRVEAKFHE